MLTLLQTINSLNNAILLSKTQIKITKFNNLTLKVLLTLQRLNYIDSFLLNNVHTQCTIFLSKKQNTVFFQQIQSVSTPHKFIYITYSDLVKLKEKLFNLIGFTDGYMYKDSNFNVDYITKKFHVKDNISCKLVSIEDDMMRIIDKLSNDGIKIYQFYDREHEILYKSLNQISIEIDEVNDICKILK